MRKLILSTSMSLDGFVALPWGHAVGDGLPLFKDLSAQLPRELVEAQTYSTGACLHVYRRARRPA